MDFNKQDLERETMFKDSILSSAEAKSMAIISKAEQQRKKALEKTQASCEVADYDSIAARLARNFDRELSAAMQEARKGLLAHRSQLVEQVFNDAKKELLAFAQSDAYLPWMQSRLVKHAALAQKGNVTVYIRTADLTFAQPLESVFPGCTITANDTILIGGLKISDGHRLFDETLDAGLAAEQEDFYSTSKLAL